ncbi:hypothetical protein SKAU_G00255540 [Synaphobranchus kaupii]|uniref:Uncharacterized protein n=1 Tax=Synaphobranchus kaupii TaxID=118154 RepID=A0A9Q1F3T9_SYNKA|nr:hypothetical protein SKAU_G00255540 [Synaphobranchus kaupii]
MSRGAGQSAGGRSPEQAAARSPPAPRRRADSRPCFEGGGVTGVGSLPERVTSFATRGAETAQHAERRPARPADLTGTGHPTSAFIPEKKSTPTHRLEIVGAHCVERGEECTG